MKKTNEDSGLLEQLARREEGAADAFVRRYKPLLWTLARGRCGNPEDAEDAVQEIFLEIWRTAHRYDRSRGSEGNFVATVAKRRLVDRFRRQKSRPTMDEIPDSAASGDASPERRLIVSNISNAMDALRPDHRRILEMSLVEGYTHVEIAEAMELPLGTVKTVARRGVQRVREDLHPT